MRGRKVVSAAQGATVSWRIGAPQSGSFLRNRLAAVQDNEPRVATMRGGEGRIQNPLQRPRPRRPVSCFFVHGDSPPGSRPPWTCALAVAPAGCAGAGSKLIRPPWARAFRRPPIACAIFSATEYPLKSLFIRRSGGISNSQATRAFAPRELTPLKYNRP